MTSITLGLVIIYELLDSGAVTTQKNTLSPSIDLALGGILLALAFVLATGRQERLAERRRAKKAERGRPDHRGGSSTSGEARPAPRS